MTKIIVVTSGKGGVGKTTSSASFALFSKFENVWIRLCTNVPLAILFRIKSLLASDPFLVFHSRITQPAGI